MICRDAAVPRLARGDDNNAGFFDAGRDAPPGRLYKARTNLAFNDLQGRGGLPYPAPQYAGRGHCWGAASSGRAAMATMVLRPAGLIAGACHTLPREAYILSWHTYLMQTLKLETRPVTELTADR